MTNEEKELDDKIAKDFFDLLEEARKLLSTEGGEVGLCEYCLGSDRVYIKKDGYTGVQGKEDNKIVTTIKCFHDAEATGEDLPF